MAYIPIILSEIFSVQDILAARGFNVVEVGTCDDLIIAGLPLPKNSIGGQRPNQIYNLIYDIYNNIVLRLELLDFINGIEKVYSHEIKELTSLQNFVNSREAYSHTFEWFVGELMVREFCALSSSFSVKISNIMRYSDMNAEVGDFDVISIQRDLSIAYFECKTGGFKRNKIFKAVERALALHSDFVIFFVDDKIKEKDLSQMLDKVTFPITNLNVLKKISISGLSVAIYNWMNCYFLSFEEDSKIQINTVLRINQARKLYDYYTSDADEEGYRVLGYNVKEIKINNC